MKGVIYLEDGTVFKGEGFGAEATNLGELVFNTGMTGYQKTFTDPSYAGQIITMTYPLIGNYGIGSNANESEKIHCSGVVARDISPRPSNWTSQENLDEWMRRMKTPGIFNVDTRQITRKIRKEGTMKCVISTEALPLSSIEGMLKEGRLREDQMKTAGTQELTNISYGSGRFNVAVLDMGVKKGILDELRYRDIGLILIPYGTPCEEVLSHKPDGILISNGPGNPDAAVEEISIVRELVDRCDADNARTPIMGICMGHQLLALAAGGSTYKLKFGHRGCNHGVYDKTTGRSYITSQNHGYAVMGESVMLTGYDVTHLNLNDGTVEGMRHIRKPVFSVQFHPESNPGPNDSSYLFEEFVSLMEGGVI